jgi:hypothetical protein
VGYIGDEKLKDVMKRGAADVSLWHIAKLEEVGIINDSNKQKALKAVGHQGGQAKKANLKSIADIDRSGWTPDDPGNSSIGYMEWEDGTEMTPQEIQDYFEVNHELYDDIMQDINETINKMISDELITEMRQRTLNEISQIVMREDFYGFINAGNNMLRSLEERGYDMRESKKYLGYLVKHNIM